MEAAVVSGIFKVVGNKLVPLLIKEHSSIVGVQKDLQELKDQVEEIDFWLETVRDENMRNDWLKKLKDVAYAVDDVVDEFQLKADKHDANGDGGMWYKHMCTKPKSVIFQCKSASKVKAIKKRFAAIVKQRTDFSAIANSLAVRHLVRHTNKALGEMPLLPEVDMTSVLGRDKEKHEIISKLVETKDQQTIKMVSIIGLGGSGKTTFAKLIFNDVNIIEKHFEVKLWVHVSQEFDVTMLVKKLFEAIACKKSEQYPLQEMSKTISGKLTGKRYLLVLDDVWIEDKIQWEQFMVHLKNGARGSGILLTTRNRNVANLVGSTYHFDLPYLSKDHSWQLFQQSLVMPAEGLEVEFVEIGKQIVKKCGGVPLAIKVLAGALHDKKRIEQWQAIRDNSLLDAEGAEPRVYKCLWLSYLNLPYHLKPCFTICSLFPKGYKIDKELLIDLWIAHDMIAPVDGLDYLEDIGCDYFNSLVQISFLQDESENSGQRVKCRMHDLVHDLARSVLDDQISLCVATETTNSKKSYRYFSLTEEPSNLAPQNLFKKARAVYVDVVNNSIFDKAWKNAKHLRSITVDNVGTQSALTAILETKNLRYLETQGLKCEALPESISDIWSLQALHLTSSSYLVELPKSIGKLQKLRTLNLSQCEELQYLPDSIGDCQMILSIDLSKCKKLTVLPDSIGRNRKLRVLRLSETRIERLPSSITTLRNLECLDLSVCFELVELPEGICNLEKLQVLNIKCCHRLGGMPVGIGQLSRLQKLELFVVGDREKSARISELANVGRNTQDLTIRDIPPLMEPHDAHMACLKQKTNLQRLHLDWCPCDMAEADTRLVEAVLDGLEPPPGIKELLVYDYTGRKYADWMQNQVGGRVQEIAPFPFLRVMGLFGFPNLKHLDGLVELPCLEELYLARMPSIETISGGPFPSLVRLNIANLRNLRHVWMVAHGTMPDGEEEEDCSNCAPYHMGQILVGNRVTDMQITDCPKLKVTPYLPSSLQQLLLSRSSKQLLQSPCQCHGSSSSSSFSHLKKLRLFGMTGSRSGGGWELLQHMMALDSLEIQYSDALTNLPESLGSLTSLQTLLVRSCSAIGMLPECLGELQSLQELTIEWCNSLSSLPQSMGHLTSLQSLCICQCHALCRLPNCLGELRSLRRLWIAGLPGLACFPQSLCGLTSLENLVIEFCPGLTSLPQGMKSFASLKYLKVFCCPGIKSLPEDIRALTALKCLVIGGCPDLERRCEARKGEDWHLISHIPHVLG